MSSAGGQGVLKCGRPVEGCLLMSARHVVGGRVSTKEIAEVAEAIVDRLTPASDTALPVVETPDLRTATAAICGLFGSETPPAVPTVAFLGRADWARRSICAVLPSLRILEDLWQQDEPPDPMAGAAVGRVFGPLLGNTAVDLAGWALGDFDVQLANPHDPGVVALPIENLVVLAESWTIPLPSVVKWAVACSLASRLLLTRERLGVRVSLLALRYRVEMSSFFQGAMVGGILGGAGPLDVDLLMGARTPKQMCMAKELASLADAIACVGLQAWRLIDDAHSQALEDRLVEALRRRRAHLPRSGVVAEFWLGVPLGPVPRPEVRAVVERLASSPAGLAALWRDRNLLDAVEDSSTIAAAPVIPGKPRMASLGRIPRREVPQDSPEYRKLRAELETVLASPLSPAQAEVVQGRLAGLSTDESSQTLEALPSASDGYRSGLMTSWLQEWLMAIGAPMDKRLELATTLYAAVMALPANEALLRSRTENDLLTLHLRAMIQIERRSEYLESGLELALLAWLGSIVTVDFGPQGLIRWKVMRQQRLKATADRRATP